MSGLRRIRRHPDRRFDPHARATMLASDRMLEPLADADAAWLDEHLAACAPCRERAEAFAADAALLAGLRASPPPPPRDLAARLAGALDREIPETRPRGRRTISISRTRRQPRVVMVGLWAAAVIALVALPLVWGLGGPSQPNGPGGIAAATPIAVPPQPVAWINRAADGRLVLSVGTFDHVCADTAGSACGTLYGTAQTQLSMTAAQAVMLDPSGGAAVVVGSNSVYAVTVPEAVTRPSPRPSPQASPGAPSPTPAATGVSTSPPVGTPVPTGPASIGPVPSASAPVPSSSTAPSSGEPSTSPSLTPSPSVVPSPSEASASASAPPPATPSPSATAGASTAASPSPSASPSPGSPGASASGSATVELPTSPLATGSLEPSTPAPSAAASYAIAEGVVLVGAPAAYSPDGQWVAFSARPQDGHQGPDLYLWAVGDATARVITTNHATVFSGWLDDQILVSVPIVAAPTASPSPSADGSAAASAGASSAASPAGSPGASSDTSPAASPDASEPASPSPSAAARAPRPIAAAAMAAAPAPAASRTPAPSGAPSPSATTGSAADTLVPAPATADPASVTGRSFLIDPATGSVRVVGAVGMWRPVVDPTDRTVVYWTGHFAWSRTQSAWVPDAGTLMVAGWRSAHGRSAVTDPTQLPSLAGDGQVVAWDARFDPSARHLAAWTSDRAGAVVGSLSLIDVNPDGTLGKTRFQTDAALMNYSLDAGRLVWATAPGQNGQGSVVAVYAWTKDGGGRLDSAPDTGTDAVVVAH